MTTQNADGSDRVPAIALCHEWLARWAGSEKTFVAMASAFPSADLFALTVDRSCAFPFGGRPVRTTFLDHIPALRDRRSAQLPFMPLAWRYASRRRYDVVVSSSHACAKGFGPGRSALHLSYCYTPMRYAWLSAVDERRKAGRVGDVAEAYFRRWDRRSAEWVDEFAANSTCVRKRIEDYYGRSARVIPPPVDVRFFTQSADDAPAETFALAAGRMVRYKRLDLAIRACASVGIPLVVAGGGPEEPGLRSLAAELGVPVDFVIGPGDEALRDLYRRATVLLFPGEEDFGIIPVEAQACGTPVVAYGRGGATDTVVHGVTGVLVPEQDESALADGLRSALEHPLDPLKCRENAERFSAERFCSEFRAWVLDAAGARGLELPT